MEARELTVYRGRGARVFDNEERELIVYHGGEAHAFHDGKIGVDSLSLSRLVFRERERELSVYRGLVPF